MTNTAFDHQKHFTYGDYRKWSNDERWELIEGIAYHMTPAPSTVHQDIVGEIFAQLHAALKNKQCRPYVAPFDVRLPEGDESDDLIETVVQPDVLVVCDKAKIDKRGCRGAPDFVVEVISPYTSVKDQVTKTALYERHKVREYWTVHPIDRLLTIRILGDNGSYPKSRIMELKDNVEIETLQGLKIDLDPLGEICAPATEAEA